MHHLWPIPPESIEQRTASDAELERTYDYPQGLTRPWVQANFIAAADGAVTVDDTSRQLSHSADRRVFTLGRDLADVILVGAATAIDEQYRGLGRSERRQERRQRLGLAELPPVAVVSSSASIATDSPLITDTIVPPIVVTSQAAPAARIQALTAEGAEVIEAGSDRVHLPTALAALQRRGLRRVNCEGGPHLFASMLAEDLIDQLCLTVAPLLTGAGAGRIVAGRMAEDIKRFDLASVLHEDGYLMLRYRRSAA